MNDKYKATRGMLKRMPPNDAEAYLKSFNLPDIHYKLMYLLYVKKVPDVVQATYKLEDDKIFISIFKAGNIHRRCIEWITQKL